jgi:hypothetical protein
MREMQPISCSHRQFPPGINHPACDVDLFRSNAISTSAMRYDFSGAMAMRDCPMSSTPFLLTRDFH